MTIIIIAYVTWYTMQSLFKMSKEATSTKHVCSIGKDVTFPRELSGYNLDHSTIYYGSGSFPTPPSIMIQVLHCFPESLKKSNFREKLLT
jgi:hypothetical protein